MFTITADVLPSLPDGASLGAKIARTVYAGLGAGKKSWFKCELATPDAQWQACAPFPGEARSQALMLALNGAIYVFGGLLGQGRTLSAAKDVYQYDPARDEWRLLVNPSPLAFVGTSAVALDAEKALFFGGVSEKIVTDLALRLDAAPSQEQRDLINLAYLNQKTPAYQFSSAVYLYDARTDTWTRLSDMPFDPRVCAGVACQDDWITLVCGEIKPGLRSAQILRARWTGSALSWNPDCERFPNNVDGQPHEGVASPAVVAVGNRLYAMGGTNFPGAAQRYAQGHCYSHQGLKKTWYSNIYARLDDGQWQALGHFPVPDCPLPITPLPIANPICIAHEGSVLILGGETSDGQSMDRCYQLSVA